MAKEKKKPADRYLQYTEEIGKYEREFKQWEQKTEKILKKYRDEGREARTNAQSRFNILWSNVNTLVPACFSKLPQPDVSRRFRDNDPTGRVSSLILERALDFEIQHYSDYRTSLKQAVFDRFLGGRGTVWVRYEPHFKRAKETGQIAVGLEITEDVESQSAEELDYEYCCVDYVHWRDFGHQVARTWEEVGQVWRKVYMDKEAVVARFGKEIANELPYDATPDDLRKTAKQAQENWQLQTIIYEIWDKTRGCAVWLSKGYKDGLIEERDDPLGLQEFWPCPRPLYATLTNETLVPVPDWIIYQDQANELDVLADRIDGLAKMLQLKGTYDGAIPELKRLFTEAENGSLVAVKNYAAFAEKGGLKGAVDVVDLTPLAEAMKIAQDSMEQIKSQIYELTGIADIVRGAESEHETTATENQIKGQYASLRLRSMQDDVARFATEILQLKAQIMCSKFSPQTLLAISASDQLSQSDQQLLPQALGLLIGQERLQNPDGESPNPLRSFRIEVAADTLVQTDEEAEKQSRMEFITAIGGYFKNALPMAQQSPQLAPMMAELLKFMVAGFKAGKGVEGMIDTTIDQLKAQAAQPQQQPPDPQMMKVQAQQQADAQRLQHDQQVAQQEAAQRQQELQMESQQKERDAQRQLQLQQFQAQTTADLEKWKTQQKMEMEERQASQQRALDKWKAELDAQTKIAVAEISAKASMDQAQLDAAAKGADVNTPTPGPLAKVADKLAEGNKQVVDAVGKMNDSHKELVKQLSQKKKRRITTPEGRTYTSEEL